MTLRQVIINEQRGHAKYKQRYIERIRKWNSIYASNPRRWKQIQRDCMQSPKLLRWAKGISSWEQSLQRTLRMYTRRVQQSPIGTKKALILFHGRRHFPLCIDLERRGYITIYVDQSLRVQPDMCLDVNFDLSWLKSLAPFDVCWCQGAHSFASAFLEELDGLLSPDAVFVLCRNRVRFDWTATDRYAKYPDLLRLDQKKLAHFLGNRRFPETINQVESWLA